MGEPKLSFWHVGEHHNLFRINLKNYGAVFASAYYRQMLSHKNLPFRLLPVDF